jgi:hypothetical protein
LKSILDNLNDQLSSIEKLSDDSQDYLPKDPFEEQIQTYLPSVPKTLSGYLNGGANPTTELNTLFHYFDSGVYVFRKTEPIIPMLQINKASNFIQIGDYNNDNPETVLNIAGMQISIKSTFNKIPITFGNILFNFEYNQIK